MHRTFRRLSTSTLSVTTAVLCLAAPAAASATVARSWDTPSCDQACQLEMGYAAPRLPQLIRVDITVTNSTGNFKLPNCPISMNGVPAGCVDHGFQFYAPGATLTAPTPGNPTQPINGCRAINRYTDGTSAQGACVFSFPGDPLIAGTGSVEVSSASCEAFTYEPAPDTAAHIEFRDATGARWTVTRISWQASGGGQGTITHPGTVWTNNRVSITAKLGTKTMQMDMLGALNSAAPCQNGIDASDFTFTLEGTGFVS